MTEPTEHCIVVLCTTPNPEVAATLARGIVHARLAACVNVLPVVRSFYRWEGETKDDPESQLIIKTQRSCFEALSNWIRAEHPYTEPEIIALPITLGSASYLSWIVSETQAVPTPR